jgi:hypothetical protein
MPVPFIMERLIDAVGCVLIGFLAPPNVLGLAFGWRTGDPIAFITTGALRPAFG